MSDTASTVRFGRAPVGVLVMAYGGPESLDEIPGYLADIRAGRPTPRDVVEEITENYRAIGGRSPLLDVTRRQVDALADALGDDYRCYLGMRHWSPWIEEVVGEMVEDGIEHAVGLVLAPQFSALSVARYQQSVADGLELHRGRIEFEHVPSYHDAPGLIEAFAARVREGISRWPEDERDRVHVVFSAHSLPERVLAEGDPYDAQCRETARLVAERAGVPDERWSWSYQSAGRTPEPWAGPDLGEHLRGARRARRARRRRRPGRLRLRPRRDPVRRRRPRPRGRRRARDAARAAAGAERRSGVRRGARRPRARARGRWLGRLVAA